MATIDTSLISDPKEDQWVYDVNEIMNNQFKSQFVPAASVSVFHVPKSLTQKKPEAYEPQQIGLGPIHHFQPQPYKKMEQKKLAIMHSVLKFKQTKDNLLNLFLDFAPMLRTYYDTFLEDRDSTLGMMFAIDGLFLLNLFRTYSYKYNSDHSTELPKVGPMKRLEAQDILMLENQIPYIVFPVIDDFLHPSSGKTKSSKSGSNVSPSIYKAFCELHSPLMLCSKSQAPYVVDHLLHYMYYSIIHNVPLPKQDDQGHGHGHHPMMISAIEDGLNFFSKLPEKQIAQVFMAGVSAIETFAQNKIALIPSASTLHDSVGFEFHSLEADQGIRNIHIRERDIYLPIITLNNDSEVILRNLVAYETLTTNSNGFPLIEYMGLMCGLVMTKDDVKYLKGKNIIRGDMGDDDVAKLFTGMSNYVPAFKTKESHLTKVINDINKVYNNGARMRTYLVLMKLARWLVVVLKAIGSFVESSWKIVAFMVSIVTVFLLTSQAYCDVYGCDKKTVTLLPYGSS
ncbi:putative UPF0481 protein At3g02645 [Bidens hawaiensis]|uniref:putative UPF0481 protein At3g02645 n=1 Tax=Bidens hawaiensis TaxID=980011 RepID=UPI004049FEC8